MVFAVMLGWLPSTGRGDFMDLGRSATPRASGFQSRAIQDGARHAPCARRHARGGAPGLREVRARQRPSSSRVVLVHVLKNILVPVVTVLGLELGGLIAFSVVTETVFAWPGMGKLLIDSIQRLDRPVVVAYLIITVLMFVVINWSLTSSIRCSIRACVCGRQRLERRRRDPAVTETRDADPAHRARVLLQSGGDRRVRAVDDHPFPGAIRAVPRRRIRTTSPR